MLGNGTAFRKAKEEDAVVTSKDTCTVGYESICS